MPHLNAARNLARWLARDPDVADDIVQDAVLRAFRAFDALRGEAKPWLLAIVRNCHRTTMRQRTRRSLVPLPEPDEETEELTAADEDPEARAIRSDHRRKLDDLVASLPLDFRETLILKEMEDLSYREIAQATGVPIGTVMSRLARARALLREKWRYGHDMQ